MENQQPQICPRCNREFTGGAMSRRDNQNICDECCRNEAAEDYFNNCII